MDFLCRMSSTSSLIANTSDDSSNKDESLRIHNLQVWLDQRKKWSCNKCRKCMTYSRRISMNHRIKLPTCVSCMCVSLKDFMLSFIPHRIKLHTCKYYHIDVEPKLNTREMMWDLQGHKFRRILLMVVKALHHYLMRPWRRTCL